MRKASCVVRWKHGSKSTFAVLCWSLLSAPQSSQNSDLLNFHSTLQFNSSMATTTTTIPNASITPFPVNENPKKTQTLDAAPQQSKATAAEASADDASLSDIDKKIRRAERFGISVQLSEQEKRNSRAQRFGTALTLEPSDASKSEELKRKARAERFGMPTPVTAADEDTKKKARLARFAPISKTDLLEEEKRKARAVRFSNPSSAISGKAGSGA